MTRKASKPTPRVCAVCGADLVRILPRTAQLGTDDTFVPVCDRCFRATPAELQGEAIRAPRMVGRAPRPGRLPQPQRHAAIPTAEDFYRLRAIVAAKIPRRVNSYTPEGQARRERQISLAFAAELRKRGWLLRENEGAAPGSWWTPGGEKPAKRNQSHK